MFKKHDGMHDKILGKLNKYIQKVTNILQRDFHRLSINQVIIQQNIEPPSKYRFGGFLEDKTLVIDERVINSNLIDAILAREAFLFVFTECIRLKKTVPAILLDLAMEFGRHMLTNKKSQKQWRELWKNAWRERISNSNNNWYQKTVAERYVPFEIFPRYNELTACNFLSNLANGLLYNLSQNVNLPYTHYTQLINESLVMSPIHLKPMEILVLNEITKHFKIDIDGLIRKFKLSPKTIKDIINGLLRKQIITKFEAVRFEALKLNPYIVFIESTNKEIMNEIMQGLMANNPYIYSVFKFYGQKDNVAIIFLGPANKKFSMNLRKFIKYLNDINGISRAEFYKRDEWDRSYNLSYYNAHKKNWEIDWSTWFHLSKKRLESENYLDIFTRPFIKLEEPSSSVEIKQQDLKILSFFDRLGKVPIRKIREKLKVRTNTIIERLRYLRKNNILTLAINIGYIGLPEIVALIIDVDEYDVLRYKSVLDMLPATIIARTSISKSTLQSAIFLPLGESTLFSYYAYKLFSHLDLNFRIMFSSVLLLERYWRMPVKLWDEERQDWIVPDNLFAPII